MNMLPAAPGPARGTILLLAMIAALGSLATQLLIPALPQLAQELRSNAADAQIVIGIYLAGLGAGQLFAGPLADRLGRRPVLLAGLAIYCAASLVAALAPNIELLLVARLFQALGGAAGVVTARVLVGDLYAPHETAGKQATLMGVVLVSPALAPVFGGLLSEVAGWRSLFVVLAMAGMLGALVAVRALPETRTRGTSPEGTGIASHFARLAQDTAFQRPALSIIGGSAALYMYLGTAPFLLAAEHGLRPRAVGLCLMLGAGASIAGTMLVTAIERRGDAVRSGSLLLFGAALALLLAALTGHYSLPVFLVTTTVLGLGAGISGPAAIARVIAAQKGMEGTAASLSGASQMLLAAFAAALLGRFAPVSPVELGGALVIATSVAAIAAWRPAPRV